MKVGTKKVSNFRSSRKKKEVESQKRPRPRHNKKKVSPSTPLSFCNFSLEIAMGKRDYDPGNYALRRVKQSKAKRARERKRRRGEDDLMQRFSMHALLPTSTPSVSTR